MKDILKHAAWELLDGQTVIRGLMAVKVEYDRLSLKSLVGPDMPVEMLLPLLNATLPDDWLIEAEKLHQSRKNPWLVRSRTGMSGCSDYFLYSLRDEEYLDQPRAASLHVSMYGKLNEGLRLWMGDLPPLLAAVLQDYPPDTDASLRFSVYEPVLRDGYRNPGANSGLQSVIDSLKAMEVMSE
jgi:hypothetical protein